MGIILDILRVASDYGRQGAAISSISRMANLSHYTAIKKCQKLVDFGVMESRSDKKSRIYVVTEKGILFFQEMQKFIEVIQEVKIRY